VDREERPDIDNIYMSASLLLTGSGGWPLNVMLTPDKKPFYATTYVPKESRYGRPGMMELVPRIKEIWKERREEIDRSAESITDALERALRTEPGDVPGEKELEAAYEGLKARFDGENGGFGGSPKFPTPHALLFLLRYSERTGEDDSLEMVEKTLRAMRRGGIYDQLGFGYHRYSTDAGWRVPHFEKMLYDQALMAYAYAEAYQATGSVEYERTAREVFEYVLKGMTSPEGAFYTAEDADSEGVEGRFYLWTADEVEEAVGKKGLEALSEIFNIKPGGNFTDPTGEAPEGANVLYLGEEGEALLTGRPGWTRKKQAEEAEALRERMFEARSGRVRPFRDDKVLADLNGLMIASLALGARAFGHEEYAFAARRAADFVLERLRPDGKLLHRWRGGEAGIRAGADDYAFLVWGLLELYETVFDPRYLKAATELMDEFIEVLWDEESGGFFLMAEGSGMPVRPKELADASIPSSNSVAVLDLIRLARMTGRGDLEEKAHAAASVFSGHVKRSPEGYAMFMASLDFVMGPSREVVVVGKTGDKGTREMLSALGRIFAPRKVVVFVPAEEKDPEVLKFAEFAEYKKMKDGKATAYVCTDYVCKAPTTDVKEMLELLERK
jgi:uncharacterized protein YyaL (SSP411 family)